jgi:glycerate-2-kinase
VINPRPAILDAFDAALKAVQSDTVVRDAIEGSASGSKEAARLIAQASQVDAIAIGKGAVAMMSGALDSLGDRLTRGFVITKDGHVDRELPGRIEVHEAAHPVLDERSVAATHRLLEWVTEISPDAMVLCLISGGGSALLEEPIAGVSLADFQQATRLLLTAGADIYQLNAVRSQLSRVKGGGLRAAIPARQVVSLLLSDVLGNDPTVIASGPTVPLRTTRHDARDVVAGLGLLDEMPQSVIRVLAGDSAPSPTTHPGDVVVVVADNETAVQAAAERLRGRGLRVQTERNPRTGEARVVAEEWVMRLRDVPPEIDAIIGGGELTVTVKGDGVGGRNTEFALAASIELERLRIEDWTVASLATDGEDGMTDVAGAIVDCSVPPELRDRHIDPITTLHANDSFPGLEEIGATVRIGPTGTNVNDLYFAVRKRDG